MTPDLLVKFEVLRAGTSMDDYDERLFSDTVSRMFSGSLEAQDWQLVDALYAKYHEGY